MEKAKNIIDFEGLLLLNELGNWAQLGLILKSCVSSLKWAQVELNCLFCLRDISFRRHRVLMEKAENNINFEGLLLLNELSNWAQLGLILKSCVSSLKWAQVELNCLFCLRDISFRRHRVLMEKAENNINFEGLLLLNELSNWAQLGLILKSCVSSFKWAQVELNCLISSADISFRSYLPLMERLPPSKGGGGWRSQFLNVLGHFWRQNSETTSILSQSAKYISFFPIFDLEPVA